MKASDFWKNFKLGEELSVAGAFIYNGLRRYHEMQSLDYTDELFEFLYELSVGFERLLKIAVVLYEHDSSVNQDELERSLMTHNHLALLERLRNKTQCKLGKTQIELLSLLSTFYKALRYDRYSLASAYDAKKERQEIFNWLGKNLKVEFNVKTPLIGNDNEDRYRSFVRRTTLTISRTIYKIIRERAVVCNLYTYELRHGSKAESVFLREVDISDEDVLWKELLIFLMNTKLSSGYLDFLRSIEPLDFDPALIEDYLDCFQSDTGKALVIDELEYYYSEMEDKGERLGLMRNIGAKNLYFESDDNDSSEQDLFI